MFSDFEIEALEVWLSVVRSNVSAEVCDILHSYGEKLINMELVPFSITPMVVSVR